MTEERMRILEMIEQGAITAAEGAKLINALDDGEDETPDEAPTPGELGERILFEEAADPGDQPPPAAPSAPASPAEPPFDFAKWRNWWFIPLAVGVVITGMSGLLVYAGNQGAWNWFWMSCVWVPLLFGIFVIVMAWFSRTARWLHVRVNTGEDEWPRRIAISLPLPFGLTALGLKMFGRYIPNMEGVPLDEAVMALRNSATPESPFYVEVEEPGGEHVQVYIG